MFVEVLSTAVSIYKLESTVYVLPNSVFVMDAIGLIGDSAADLTLVCMVACPSAWLSSPLFAITK